MKRLTCLLLTLFAAGACGAQGLLPGDPVADAELAAMRGGFVLPGGMELSFGFESGVYVNGDKVAHAIWHQGELLQSTLPWEGGGLDVSALPGGGDLVGNAIGWIVQNRLDHQVIQHYRIYDVALSGVSGLPDAGIGRMLESVTVPSLRH